MNHSGESLTEFFRSYESRGEPLALATIVETVGSTYQKPGAQMLIAGDGRVAGLLSGGCLEADLMERARSVLATGEAMRVEYDTRSSDDVIWGIGLGCEGAMSIVLTRLNRENQYQPLAFIEACRRDDIAAGFAIIARSEDAARPLGTAYWPGATEQAPGEVASAIANASIPSARTRRNQRNPLRRIATTVEAGGVTALVAPIELPPRLLVLGAGPDAMPLVEIAGLMNWRITVLDHRPAYAVAERFPRARRVALNAAAALHAELAAARYDAAVVMSHHLVSDQNYLAALAESDIPYIGLLGPAPRRARLMSEIGDKAAKLGDRLYGPIGLDIGATTPETIALAIVSEIQAVLAGRHGEPFRERAEEEEPRRTAKKK
jgi:xanthine/CO dehydrogenase XdhC/CoxF family maturation factor